MLQFTQLWQWLWTFHPVFSPNPLFDVSSSVLDGGYSVLGSLFSCVFTGWLFKAACFSVMTLLLFPWTLCWQRRSCWTSLFLRTGARNQTVLGMKRRRRRRRVRSRELMDICRVFSRTWTDSPAGWRRQNCSAAQQSNSFTSTTRWATWWSVWWWSSTPASARHKGNLEHETQLFV